MYNLYVNNYLTRISEIEMDVNVATHNVVAYYRGAAFISLFLYFYTEFRQIKCK